jgi:hypothetical protein
METHLSVNGRRKYSRRVQQPLPTDIDLIWRVQAFELHQRLRRTSMQLVHTEGIANQVRRLADGYD